MKNKFSFETTVDKCARGIIVTTDGLDGLNDNYIRKKY